MIYHHIVLVLMVINVGMCDNISEDTLVLVHGVFRHGERMPEPLISFPNDMYKNLTFYPYGIGELNKKGIIHAYNVGKGLKKRYQHFINDTYYTGIVDGLASGYNRCKMTMQSVLAGLFPPNVKQTFQEGLNWQPILYKYKNKTDKILTGFMKCLPLFFNVGTKKPSNVSIKCNNTEFLHEHLTLHSGLTVNTPKMILHIVDTLKSEVENGLKLPAWAESMYPEPLVTCAHDVWRHLVADKYLVTIAGGELIKKIYNDTMERINNKDKAYPTKFFLYAAHDLNIYVLLGMLDNYNDVMINYVSILLFEVHKIDGVYGFKVYLDNQDDLGAQLLNIPECGTFCPIDKFHERVKVYFESQPC